MDTFKQFKTQKLHVILQITETTQAGSDARRWEVHDVERGRAFRVSLAAPAVQGVKGKSSRAWTPEEIEAAVGFAIEDALVTPPEKVPGTTYDVVVTRDHLQAASAHP
jgi:hypothetical protein